MPESVKWIQPTMPESIRIHIDFPALNSLIAYLQDRDTSQRTVDQTTAAVTALTQRLQATRVLLKGAAETNNPQTHST